MSRRLVTAAASALVFVAFGLTQKPRDVEAKPPGADAPAYVRIASALGRGTLELPPPDAIDHDAQQDLGTQYGTPYAMSRTGRLVPKHPWPYALLLTPGVLLGGAAGAWVCALLLSGALVGITVWCGAEVAGPGCAAAAALALFLLLPAVRNVALGISVDTAIALVMVVSHELVRRRRETAGFALAAASLLLRPTLFVLFAPAFLFLLSRQPRRARSAALGLAAGGALCGLHNLLLFGAPWTFAYQRVVVWRDGQPSIQSHVATFDGHPLAGLRMLLVDTDYGLIVFAPIAFVAVLGYVLPNARRPEWIAASVGALASYLMLSPYRFVLEHADVSYRFAFPFLVSVVPPLAALLGRIRGGGGAPLAASTREVKGT